MKRHILIGFLLTSLSWVAGASHKVTISSPNLDRTETVVSIALPAGMGREAHLLDDQNQEIPLQVRAGADGAMSAVFVVRDLKANQSRAFVLEAGKAPEQKGSSGVTVRVENGKAQVNVGGRSMLAYQGAKTKLPEGYDPVLQRGGYIHPVMTPSGIVVSDDYPSNHKHHHGIWSPWTKTEFEGRQPDFWNMGGKTGTVEFVGLRSESQSGPWLGEIVARHRMVDLSAKPEAKAAINEEWTITPYNVGLGASSRRPHFVFDLSMVHTCASQSPLMLPKYHYGGLGFRGAWDWNGKDGCTYLTSEGKTREDGNETRARWCRITGKVGGKVASIVIMDSPGNFRHPQPVRLHPTEPFVCYAPSSLGDWKIEPGKPYAATYRFITMDGEISREEIERLYADWANPVTVKVE